jgi:hypothetical protein
MKVIRVEQKPIPPHIQEQIARNLRTGRGLARQAARLDRRLARIIALRGLYLLACYVVLILLVIGFGVATAGLLVVSVLR